MLNSSAKSLFRYLPIRISLAVQRLPDGVFENINEIRLRKNAPISVTVGNKNLVFDQNGTLCKPERALTPTESEITECVLKLTDGSLYTCDKFIEKGFIPLANGGRAGVCGRSNGNGFSEIYSINLRLHRFLPNVAMPLITEFKFGGLSGALVCSPPALGKTTFLRSVAYLLSIGATGDCVRVGVADERAELASGISGYGLLDIISGLPKSEAITLLTRSMSPQIIVCDEISPNETEPLLEAQNTGVNLIASAHCISPADLKRRGRMKLLLESGLFPISVLLGYDSGYSCKIAKTEDFL